jgi:hypothetical protein
MATSSERIWESQVLLIYVELYLNTFSDYLTSRDDEALRARNIEIAKEKCIDYFS